MTLLFSIHKVNIDFRKKGVLHLKTPDDPQEVFAEYTVPAPPTEFTETPAQRKLVYEYDELGRAIRRILYKDEAGSSDADVLWTRYNYADGGHGSGSTTGLVHLLEQSDRQTTYTYDAVGNITGEETYGRRPIETRMAFQTEHNELLPLVFETKQLPLSMELDKRSYAYDKMGQLTRADIQNAGESWTYAYDQGSNILRKTRYEYAKGSSPLGAVERDIRYTYGDPNWKDKLTAYNGRAITYDAIGNPLTYNGREYVWQKGRELAAIKEGGYTAVSFTYDHTGLRATKWSYGAETHYTYNGTKLTHLKNEVKNVQMHFYYDTQGRASMVRYNGVDYAYAHNLQGDVIRLIDMDGNSVVEYLYDPWGALIQTRGSMKSTLGLHNPLRYRGYVYDEETGLYYLRSRYYNPEWGRFVNADLLLGNPGRLLSHSIFTYCENNPVMNSDPSGESLLALLAIMLGISLVSLTGCTPQRPRRNSYPPTGSNSMPPLDTVMNGREPYKNEVGSPTVENIQRLLRLGGYPIEEIDGDWGENTQKSVKKFQEDYNGGAFHIGIPEIPLKEDGLPGDATQRAIVSMFGGHEAMIGNWLEF